MSLTSSPKLIKGGLIVMAPGGGAVRNIIALQIQRRPAADELSRCRASAATAAASVRSRSG